MPSFLNIGFKKQFERPGGKCFFTSFTVIEVVEVVEVVEAGKERLNYPV